MSDKKTKAGAADSRTPVAADYGHEVSYSAWKRGMHQAEELVRQRAPTYHS